MLLDTVNPRYADILDADRQPATHYSVDVVQRQAILCSYFDISCHEPLLVFEQYVAGIDIDPDE